MFVQTASEITYCTRSLIGDHMSADLGREKKKKTSLISVKVTGQQQQVLMVD